MGFVSHVPHYVANLNFPRASLTLLSEVSASTGLVFSLDALRERADQADRELNAQISENDENQQVVRALEESFDALVAERGVMPVTAESSAEDLAAQVEKFLAEMDARENE